MKGQEIRSLINLVSKSKSQLPFMIATGGLGRLTQFNQNPDINFKDPDFQAADVQPYVAPDDFDNPPLGKEVLIEPIDKEHKSTQIWLHGLGDSAEGFAPNFKDPGTSPVEGTTRVRLITAPYTPVTINYEMQTNSWFDITEENFTPGFYSLPDVIKNTKLVNAIIEEEIKKVGGDSKKVFIGGSSQGAAMALYVGLGYDKPLGGVIGISGFKLEENITNENNKNTPIFLAHGTDDEVLPFINAQITYEKNRWISEHNVNFHEVRQMKHRADHNVLKLIREFMVSLT